jgi:hypothetical protein
LKIHNGQVTNRAVAETFEMAYDDRFEGKERGRE